MTSKAVKRTTNGIMSKDEKELVLRDLQGLLREVLGDEVIVVKYNMINMLPKGENYASTILKVDSVIKRSKDSLEENLPLVAKMIPTSEFQQNYIDNTCTFGKEIFVYKTLVSAFRELEREAGIRDEDLIDIMPKYYGGRLSMNKNKLDVADGDAVMLMENLTERGYYTLNRMKGLDLDHAKLAMTELARFHALSMALKLKKPKFFEEAKKPLDLFPFGIKEEVFAEAIKHTIAAILEDSRISKYEDRIRASTEAYKDIMKIMRSGAEEPWVAISHGDFWVNNILFRQENGRVKDVKFVDFQVTRITSPMKDLPYFLCTSVRTDVIENSFDELIEIYYNNLIAVLKKTDCDTSPFVRKRFDKQLNKDAKSELLRCLLAAKFFTKETVEDLDDNDVFNSMMISKPSNLYLDRSWLIVSKFAEQGWI